MTEKLNTPIYIIAVSGGVDSAVLTHKLLKGEYTNSLSEGARFVIAHVNHGIRDDSSLDQQFVRELAKDYDCSFETIDLNLGPDASEEQARVARYAFLEEVRVKHRALAIITAHHQDDVIETAVHNLLRGTNHRGLTSLKSIPLVQRPMLGLTKAEIVQYAQANNLAWHEDSTNSDERYTRNRIRHSILSKAQDEWKKDFGAIVQKQHTNGALIDKEIASILNYHLKGTYRMSRKLICKLDHLLACELVYALLVKACITGIDKSLVESVVLHAKVARPGRKLDLDKNTYALVTKRSLRLINRNSGKTRNV